MTSTATPEIDIADVNEFHPLVDGFAYAKWSPIVILRVSYANTHVDNAFASGVAQAAAIPSRGFYAYLVQWADAFSQGVFFAQNLMAHTKFQPADFISFDIEEGTGDLSSLAENFLNGVRSILKESLAQDFGYSGTNFWSLHLASVNNVHRWIASWFTNNVPPNMNIWQFTDAQVVPGVSGACDCSRFYGTYADFLKLIGVTSPTPTPPAPPTPTEVQVNLPILQQGARGDSVRAVQKLAGVAADGIFGPNTHAAVLAVQRAHGLSQDGIVGTHTWGALLGAPQ